MLKSGMGENRTSDGFEEEDTRMRGAEVEDSEMSEEDEGAKIHHAMTTSE